MHIQGGLKLPLRPLHGLGLASKLVLHGGHRDNYFHNDQPIYDSGVFNEAYNVPPSRRGSSFQIQNQRQIGVTLLGVGFALTVLGVMLFFEKNLLRFGNILVLAGISLFVGPERVVSFFMQPHRMRATVIVLLGSFLVFTGKPRYGIVCQLFGLLNLFGNMFPLLLAMGRQIPIIGDVILLFDNKRRASSRQEFYDYDPSAPKYYPQF